MHSTGSFLYTVLERVRAFVDEPENAKYDNDFIVRHLIEPAMSDVLSRMSMTEEFPVLARLTITTVVDQEFYTLPPCVREVVRLAKHSDKMWLVDDWKPGRSEFSPWGPGWRLDGNAIRFNPVPTLAEDWVLWFIPSPAVQMHYSDAGGAANDATTATTFTLAASPTLGALDRRENAYLGCVVRSLRSDGLWEERVVSAYNPTTRVCTLRRPFTGHGATSGLRYEVGPYLDPLLWEAVSIRAAHKLAVWRRATQAQLSSLIVEFSSALKTARDTMSTRQTRTARSLDLDVIDREVWDL